MIIRHIPAGFVQDNIADIILVCLNILTDVIHIVNYTSIDTGIIVGICVNSFIIIAFVVSLVFSRHYVVYQRVFFSWSHCWNFHEVYVG